MIINGATKFLIELSRLKTATAEVSRLPKEPQRLRGKSVLSPRGPRKRPTSTVTGLSKLSAPTVYKAGNLTHFPLSVILFYYCYAHHILYYSDLRFYWIHFNFRKYIYLGSIRHNADEIKDTG